MGGMGEVYLARDLRLGRKVAIKMIRRREHYSSKDEEHFLQEARATARFSHPNIVLIYEAGKYEDDLYLALEYLDGENLRERMRSGPLSVSEVESVGLAVARGLAEAHRNRILHKDIKPENVFLCRDGFIKLVDFGVAQEVDEASTVERNEQGKRVVRGSPGYLAPEQWGAGRATTATDIWAFGVLLYEMIVGHRPYSGSPRRELSKLVRSAKPIQPPEEFDEIPRDLADLVLHMLDKQPSQRPTASEIAGILEHARRSKAAGRGAGASPYRGLLPFNERHADLFFGRDAEIAEFLEKIRVQPLLPVVGPSGAGKSSFVRAGVISALRERGRWVVLHMRPGARPFVRLASQLISGGGTLGSGTEFSLTASLRSGSGRHDLGSADKKENEGEDSTRTVVDMPSSSDFEIHASREALVAAQGQEGVRPETREPVAVATSPGSGEDVSGRHATSLDSWQETGHEEGAEISLDTSMLAVQLEEEPGLLALKLRDLAHATHSNVFLFVDQMEELYTMVQDTNVQERFMAAMCRAADDAFDPVRVSFTLRDDFLGRAATTAETRAALSQVTVIRSPGPDALREIIEKPLAAVGYSFEDSTFVDDMIADVHDEANSLPLLQFTARVLWDRRDQKRRLILRSAYEAIGGVAGALADHSDAVLAGMSADEIFVAKQLLLRLVTKDGTRKVVARKDLLDNLGPLAEDVLGRLTKARLLAVRQHRDGIRADADVELVHESLITRWRRLSRWINESREGLAFVEDLRQAAELWHKRGRRSQDAWHGDDLKEARRTVAKMDSAVPSLVLQFLDAGMREANLRRVRRRWRRISSTTILVGIAGVSLLVAWMLSRQKREADYQRRQADLRRVEALKERAEAQRESARAAMTRGAFLSARAKVRSSLETLDSPMGRALWRRLSGNPLLWRKDLGSYVYNVAFSPDGRTLAAGSQDHSIYLLDTETLSTRFLRGHDDQVIGVAFSPSGEKMASLDWGGAAIIWDVATGTSHKLPGRTVEPSPGIVFSRDERFLYGGEPDGTIAKWDVAEKTRLVQWPVCHGRPGHVSFSADVRYAFVDCLREKAHLIALPSMKEVRVFRHRKLIPTYLVIGPKAKVALAGRSDHRISVVELKTGKIRMTLPARYTVSPPSFSLDGRFVAYNRSDMSIDVWNIETGVRTHAFRKHKAATYVASFSPDGKRLAVSRWDKTVSLWSLDTKERMPIDRGHGAQVYDVDCTRDGRHLATAGMDGTIRVWETTSGRQIRKFSCKGSSVAVAFGPKDKLLYGGCGANAVEVWDWKQGMSVRSIRHKEGLIQTMTVSPDGNLLAMGTKVGVVVIWNMTTGRMERRFGLMRQKVFSIAFSSDSRFVAAVGRGRAAKVWDIQKGKLLQTLTGPNRPMYGVAFSRDGKSLYTTGGDHKIRGWNLATGKSKVLLTYHTRVYTFALRPDGVTFGVPTADHTAFIWNMKTGQKVILRGHRDEVNILRFTPDGKRAVTTSDDGTVRLWDVATGRPLWRTIAMLDKPMVILTHRGWQSLEDSKTKGHGDHLPQGFVHSKWKHLLEASAELGVQSPDGRLFCVKTKKGTVEAVDTDADRILFQVPMNLVSRVVALPSGCLVLSGTRDPSDKPGKAVLLDRSGKRTTLLDTATAIAWSHGHIIVASTDRVVLFDVQGHRQTTRPGVKGVTAVGQVGDWLVLGNRDGNMQLVSKDPGRSAPSFMFENLPSSQVLRLKEGPMETIIAGYANGLVGLWTTNNGTRIQSAKLHGAITHMLLRGGRLYVATELGDHAAIDLSVFSMEYCSLLRQIWKQVPVLWHDGLPVRRRPTGHRCFQSQTSK